MAAGVFEAIGVISGVLGILQFGIDSFPKSDPVGSTVRIAVGLDSPGGLDQAGGDFPDIQLFNEAGKYLGEIADDSTIENGGIKDVMIRHDGDSTQQATYTLFTARQDAICIAYTTITWPSGDQYAWTGDWGRQCGATWYFSNLFISGSDRKPDCMWIDSDGNQPQTGFQIHWPEFAKINNEIPPDSGEQSKFIDRLCTAGPPFKFYTEPDPRSIVHDPIVNARSYAPPKQPVSARFHKSYRRADGASGDPASNNLVVSSGDQHSAKELCESPTSLGPDFMNKDEGSFCRMSDKTIFPVCDAETSDNCFNADSKQLIVNGVSARDAPYDKVIDWTSA